jgi:hypothetical protein
MTSPVECALAALFPPNLRSLGPVWPEVEDPDALTEDGVGQVREKQYANGIERTFAELEGIQ